nr:immunoglobulin heavy chain junction region [Macaca mulatta]MOV87660.1 immunoglobulin heavy chain junction region [Macaca mulatta]MOV88303.1 immunoglobulin heavy chain junction region [Macaca mulatta]MOV89853.1 immunoglobulin heavy chain junction region [Macaca mulatta]MOV90337.1 immunoglobulin heavy chain junction region [Macaca mulatta]
CAKQEDSLDVW